MGPQALQVSLLPLRLERPAARYFRPLVVRDWIEAAPLFALKGQPHVSLGHSAATPQVATEKPASSPERATLFRGHRRVGPPFQG